MESTIAGVAELFSRHEFAEVYPHLAPDVQWISVGGEVLQGTDAVIEACEESREYLANVTTEFQKFTVIADADAVAINSLARYLEADQQVSVVASCDIYEFVAGRLTTITSYTVELAAD